MANVSEISLPPVRIWLDDPGVAAGDAAVIVEQSWLRDLGLANRARRLLTALMGEILTVAGMAPGDQNPHMVAWLAANAKPAVLAVALHFGVIYTRRFENRVDARLPTITDFVRAAGLDDRSLTGFFTQRSQTIGHTLLAFAPHDLSAAAKRALEERARRAWYVADKVIAPLIEVEASILTFALGLLAAPVIADLGALGTALDFGFRGFLFLVDFSKAIEDDELTTQEVIILVVHAVGFIPVTRFQQTLGAASIVALAAGVLKDLSDALAAIIGFDQLDQQISASGATITATDDPVRLSGDVLQALLKNHPELETQIGRSTEADIRAKILNSLVASQEIAAKPPAAPPPGLPAIPPNETRIMALESLDPNSSRNFAGRSIANPFDARSPRTFPRLVTCVLEVADAAAMAKAADPMKRIVSHYERMIVYAEAKTEAVSFLEGLSDPKVRRPDFTEVRAVIGAAELGEIRGSDGQPKPVFQQYLNGLAQKGEFLTVRDASIKSIDMNTFLGGEAREEHVDKHQRTINAVVKHLQERLRIRLRGTIGIYLTEFYHFTPQEEGGTYVLEHIDRHTIQNVVQIEDDKPIEILQEARPGKSVKGDAQRARFMDSVKKFAATLAETLEMLRKSK